MPIVLGDLRNAGESGDYPVIDALAAIARDGALLLSLVHRGSSGPIEIQVELDGFHSRGKADILTLAAEHPWDKNSLGQPDAVTPRRSHSTVDVSQMTLTLQPWSVTRVRIAC
jgi:alpha-L-arabinofuranosidase